MIGLIAWGIPHHHRSIENGNNYCTSNLQMGKPPAHAEAHACSMQHMHATCSTCMRHAAQAVAHAAAPAVAQAAHAAHAAHACSIWHMHAAYGICSSTCTCSGTSSTCSTSSSTCSDTCSSTYSSKWEGMTLPQQRSPALSPFTKYNQSVYRLVLH